VRDLFFHFDTLDKEIEKKLLTRGMSGSDLMPLLLERLEKRFFPREDLEKLDRFYQVLAGADFAKETRHYLSHPIRVAASYLELLKEVRYLDMAFALGHNLKEKMGDAFGEISDELLPRQAKLLIESLTIDRARERDHDYLNQFYSQIEKCGMNPMLFKALDKLDNALCWVILDLEPYHAEIVLDFVCPRIQSAFPQLEEYLRQLVRYAASREAREKFSR
jgi:signal transduction histidine kinase